MENIYVTEWMFIHVIRKVSRPHRPPAEWHSRSLLGP